MEKSDKLKTMPFEKVEQHDRLLSAVNDAALSVRNGWIFFVGMMAFFFIAVAGVTHQDLLLNSPVQLPLVKIDIELTRFFQFAPLAVVLFHFGILLQYTLLAGKTLALHDVLEKAEKKSGSGRTHPLRMELSSYFFVQAMAGPARSPILSVFLKAMTVLTLGLFPLILLVYFQTTYLAFHDSVVTWAHRIYIIADLLVLLIIGIFTQFPNKEFRAAFSSHIREHSLGIYITLGLSVFTLFYSFCIATIPDNWLDRTMTSFGNATYLSTPVPYGTTGKHGRRAFLPTAWLFEGRVDEGRGHASSLFSRNLVVMDVDLVPFVNAEREQANEVSLHLRGRDLRYADFSLSDMHRADFKEANLKEAKLSQTNLAAARFRGAILLDVDLRNAQLQGADLRWAKMNKVDLRGGNLSKAKLASTNLQGANLKDVNFRGANLQWVNLMGANLQNANLSQAILSQANIQSANLDGAELQGADLFKANLYSSILRNTQMQRVILLWANLQAADLRGAKMQGGDLRSTNMEMTDLRGAKMQGTDLLGANMQFSDLRNVEIWQTNPPSDDFFDLITSQNIKLKNPNQKQEKVQTFEEYHKKTPQEKRREANQKRLATLFQSKNVINWKKSEAHTIWKKLKGNKKDKEKDNSQYKIALSDALSDIGCRDRSKQAWILSSIVRRATDVYKSSIHTDNIRYFPPFNGDIKQLYKRVMDQGCKAAKLLPQELVQKLKQAASKS